MQATTIQKIFERQGFFVSRETLDKLATYEALLRKWQKAINLVSEKTLDDVATRHFYDSAQLFRYIPDTEVTLADMGSGAGFPAMVLAILGVKDVHLIESDARKSTFLREVSRETSTPVTVHDKRVEDVKIPTVDVVTARALAPLEDLLAYSAKITHTNHPFYCLFLKGIQYQEEIEKARQKWGFDAEVFPSQSDVSGKIIKISGLHNKT